MNLTPPTEKKPIIIGIKVVWGIPMELKPIRLNTDPKGCWSWIAGLSFENRREARVSVCEGGSALRPSDSTSVWKVRETILVDKGDHWEPHPTIDIAKRAAVVGSRAGQFQGGVGAKEEAI